MIGPPLVGHTSAITAIGTTPLTTESLGSEGQHTPYQIVQRFCKQNRTLPVSEFVVNSVAKETVVKTNYLQNSFGRQMNP